MIIIDSNVWIFAENISNEEHKYAVEKIMGVLSSEGFAINVIISSEVFHFMRVLGFEDADRRFLKILENPSAQWLEISSSLMSEAVNLSIQNRIRINDALIAAQALKFDIPILTDNVRDFKKIKGLKIIPLR